MVGGPSAYTMLFVRLIVLAVFVADMVFLFVVNIVDNGALWVHQVSGKILIGSMFVVIAAMIAANSYHAIVKGREVKRGYTTMPLDYQFVEMRDPKTGLVLRRADDPFPDRFGLKAARAYAREHYGVNA
jgi:hypothetical protein